MQASCGPSGLTSSLGGQVRTAFEELMYSVTVRGHIMIAHSFKGDVFGPAQKLHGATYVVDVELRRPELDGDGIVVDIERASKALETILKSLISTIVDSTPATRRAASRPDSEPLV